MISQLNPYRALLACIDAAVVGLMLVLSAVAYYSGQLPGNVWDMLQVMVPLSAALLIACNVVFGLYNRVWECATADTALVIAVSVTVSQVLAAVVGKWIVGALSISIWLTTWLGTLLIIGGMRFAWRVVRAYTTSAASSSESSLKRILIYGAGEAGHLLMQQLRRQRNGPYRVVGFVDDDHAKQGAIVGIKRVLGTGEDLPKLAAQYQAEEVILAMPSASRDQIRRAYDLCQEAGVSAQIIPSLLELIEEPRVRDIREISVEDVLGRELAVEDIELYDNYFRGKTVLVTGAGGSIGSELCRQICRYGPRRLILFGRGENRIHWIYLHLAEHHPEIELVPVVANLEVESSVEQLLRSFRPEVIVHAAAHKHVYLMEYVPVEAVRNNVLATARLAELAESYGVERFIFISTDKAVAPINVMGATKRMGEVLLTTRPYAGTNFICVRFGNVLGSEGSVLEIFKRQWHRGVPLSVTHSEATRYFMSIPEACFLVLQAGALGKHADTFLLRMGGPVRIVDLAREFIALQGGNADLPGAIEITGLRPGERLHEALTSEDEETEAAADGHIDRVISNGKLPAWERVVSYLERLKGYVAAEDDGGVCMTLCEAVDAELSLDHCLMSQRTGTQQESSAAGDG